MTHKDEGNYQAKHPPGTTVDETVAAMARQKTVNGEIACASAFEIAAALGVSAGEVGVALDLQELRIVKCQLGLFGYGPGVKLLKTTDPVTPAMEKAIRDRLVQGKLPCAAAWEIAAEFRLPRIAVSSACEVLALKVKPCQLGAF